ncbi:hypothetical protein [Streptomyces pimonensis]
MATTALDEVEVHSREVCGFSETDYEHNKALWLKDQPPTPLDADTVLRQVDEFEFESDTHARGVTHTTFRHLTEVLSLNGTQRGELHQLLISDRPNRHDAPLWNIGT